MSDFSNDATDDGFHEIQLSGKQLVFLFMATTVVSVVIFLCGVLVGRGVRGEALASANKPSLAGAGPQVSSPEVTTPQPPPPVSEPTSQPGADKLSYPDRLTAEKSASEHLKPPKAPEETPVAPVAAAPPSGPAQTAPVPASSVVAKDATPKGTASAPAPPPPGTTPTAAPGVWAVQVVALTDRAAAQAVVQRLVGKGYSAFLVAPTASAAVKNYKVQIGRFEDRAGAQAVANRLKAEEQFEPWILR